MKRRHPLLVLASAIVLPGMGHVVLGLATRGLLFAFYAALLDKITWHLTTPEHSLAGRLAGGLFVYALSVVDAYTWAARRARASSAAVARAR